MCLCLPSVVHARRCGLLCADCLRTPHPHAHSTNGISKCTLYGWQMIRTIRPKFKRTVRYLMIIVTKKLAKAFNLLFLWLPIHKWYTHSLLQIR